MNKTCKNQKIAYQVSENEPDSILFEDFLTMSKLKQSVQGDFSDVEKHQLYANEIINLLVNPKENIKVLVIAV